MTLRRRGIWAILVGVNCMVVAPGVALAFVANAPRSPYDPPRDMWQLPLQLVAPELPSQNIHLASRAPEVPRSIGELGQRFITVAPEPATGRLVRNDPMPGAARLAVMDMSSPTARGGGPAAYPTGTPNDVLLDVPVALPLGCTRLSVVGTPDVRTLSARFVGGPGDLAHEFGRRGRRAATGEACVREAGTYQVRVKLSGPRRALLDAELFSSREPRVAEQIRSR